MTSNKNAAYGYCLVVVLLLGMLHHIFYNVVLLLDENIHFHQIESFLQGDYGNQVASMVPGYHWTLTSLALLTGDHSIQSLRFLTLGFSFIFASAVYWTAGALHEHRVWLRASQILCLPLVLPYLPLLYTDIAAMIFPVLALGCYFRQRVFLAGIMCCLGLLFRQTNIVWLFLVYLMLILDQYQQKLSWATLLQQPSWRMHFPFLLGMLLFIVFVIGNGGIVMGGWRESHVIESLYTANIFFMYLLVFILFLPTIVMGLPGLLRWLKGNHLAWVAGFVFVIAYLVFFRVTHEWNLSRAPPPLLRNIILQFLLDHRVAFLLSAVPMLLAFWYLQSTSLARPTCWLLYPLVLLMFLPISLVEPRYHMMAFVAFLLFARQKSTWLELLQLLWLALLSGLLVWGHRQIWFFF